ncbi:MAG TPA: outer membrane beta-barrel protein [Terriglobales bacterium]|nr:outer membrane beta-barrel protein [Terriglobales bacterium]
MRRILGVLVVATALGVVAWAQLPGEGTQTGPKYPRAELFGGYVYGMTDYFNSGHVARPQGWNVSLGLNAASHLGFVFEANGLYGTSRIPVAVPAPFPPCGGTDTQGFCPPGTDTFNVDTKNYNYLFGIQIPFRRSERFTPFAEALFGHAGVRGEALSGDGTRFSVVSGGLGLVGGGGVDYNISPRFALRFKADYFQSRVFRLKQDNALFSVGIVIRTVHKKKKTLEDVDQPQP